MISRSARRREILNELREVDRLSPREVLLADKIIELQDCLLELQDSYAELLSRFNRVTVHSTIPFANPDEEIKSLRNNFDLPF